MTAIEIQQAVFAALDIYFSLPSEVDKAEAARRLKISRPTLNKRIEQGLVPCTKNGKIPRSYILNQ